MLITFKSKAAAEVIMYKEHAKRILDLLHKDLERGVITAAETAGAIATLEAEIAASRLRAGPEKVQPDEADEDNAHQTSAIVSFSARVYPLLEMLRAANKDGRDIMWGV